MLIELMKAKIHKATVIEANLDYMGSITIDMDLLDMVGILPNEKVQVVNNNNGERFETYVMQGERGSGMICLNGAAARNVVPGDIVIIIAYASMTLDEAQSFKPSIVFLDDKNKPLKLGEEKAGEKY